MKSVEFFSEQRKSNQKMVGLSARRIRLIQSSVLSRHKLYQPQIISGISRMQCVNVLFS